MTLADWIMRTATSNPPFGREAWAQAMQTEYGETCRRKTRLGNRLLDRHARLAHP